MVRAEGFQPVLEVTDQPVQPPVLDIHTDAHTLRCSQDDLWSVDASDSLAHRLGAPVDACDVDAGKRL